MSFVFLGSNTPPDFTSTVIFDRTESSDSSPETSFTPTDLVSQRSHSSPETSFTSTDLVSQRSNSSPETSFSSTDLVSQRSNSSPETSFSSSQSDSAQSIGSKRFFSQLGGKGELGQARSYKKPRSQRPLGETGAHPFFSIAEGHHFAERIQILKGIQKELNKGEAGFVPSFTPTHDIRGTMYVTAARVYVITGRAGVGGQSEVFFLSTGQKILM